MLLPHGAVIALVDGTKFELYRNAGNEAEPVLAAMTTPSLDGKNHSGTGHRSSAGNHADHLVAEDAHAGEAVKWLNEQVLGHKVDKLIVIASPRTLGEMRRHYHKQTERAVLKELARDLTGKKPEVILAALRENH